MSRPAARVRLHVVPLALRREGACVPRRVLACLGGCLRASGLLASLLVALLFALWVARRLGRNTTQRVSCWCACRPLVL
jgi:hypothetical protein